MQRAVALVINAFPLWVILVAGAALLWPSAFTWFRGGYVVWGLVIIMLGMGLTLTFTDFQNVFRFPRRIALGFCAQFIFMPLSGWTVAHTFSLEPALAAGLILVACCPDGTASNLITYLARSNVALSVVLTMCSTFAAVFMTPLLTSWLAGAFVEVDAVGLFLSTLQVVIAPVVIGVLLNHFAGGVVKRVQPVAPLISVIAIALIVGSVVGANARLLSSGGAMRISMAVIVMHGLGYFFGYWASRLLGFDLQVARTVSIDVGMQNSGLGVVLAQKHFPDPGTALPGALASVFQSIIGSLLAGYWRWRSAKDEEASPPEPLRGDTSQPEGKEG